MAQFNLENEISNILRMDGALTRGPAMRWQRKQSETEPRPSQSMDNLNVSQGTKTPRKPLSKSSPNTPEHGLGSKTPGSQSKRKTPGAKLPKTPKTPSGGDRFIPNRATTQFDLGHFKLMKRNSQENTEVLSPAKQEYQRVMEENLNGDLLSNKIISYKAKAPQAPEGYHSELKVLYSTSKCKSSSKKNRQVPQVPERILDAPDILDDYYLNLLDWSVNNHLAVALGSSVYLWNAGSGEISQLLQMDNPEDYVGAVSWIKEGNYLAVGTSCGEVQLWDVGQQKRIRNMTSHAARVGALSWNSYILSSGSRSGFIHHHDVRVPDHHVATLGSHTQEVCGLKWSPDGKYLASGGNDNILNIWSSRDRAPLTDVRPLYSFSRHQAAVKALAWSPWEAGVLASGGGTADRQICFWNCNTGAFLNSVDTKSQVCSLLWSKEYRELVSSHGYAQNQLIVWKYPTMNKVTELTGHTARVLHMAMSPDGSTVVSAGADETLRLWKCFAADQQKKTQKSASKSKPSAIFRPMIR
ncbi:cell division cycle protein 20 homolog isoform X2 [Liolophura sinensis]